MKLPIKTLCLAIAIVNMQSAFALESLDDETMSETTGEGIALLPENYSFMMNGVNPSTGVYTDNSGAGTYGTGYMRFIPVGPLTATASAKGYKKADGWLYGLSVGQSKKSYGATIDSTDWGVPFGAIGTAAANFGTSINSWGTAQNPWVIKSVTDTAVPNYIGVANSVTYLGLEAPLYNSASISSLSTSEQSAYNLKAGYWMDWFMRDAAVAESGYSGLDINNRLRLAYVWNGFSVNGSNFKIFQTLDGVTAAMGGTYNATLKINGTPTVKTFNYGLSTSYNKTFGMAGLLRVNSGTTDTRRGVVSAQNITREIRQVNVTTSGPSPSTITLTEGAINNNNDSAGVVESYRPMTNGGTDPYDLFYDGTFSNLGLCTNSGGNISSGSLQFGQCTNDQGYTIRRFKAFGTNTWTPPSERSVMRLSTQELLGGTFGTGTPALGGATGVVPDFRPNTSVDGVFLYDTNINLVLGNLYQPIMLSTDGNNFSFELARIPNNVNVYKKIYTRYSGDTGDSGVTYEGSTCNVHRCGTHPSGTNATVSANYQASSATHSSITVGSTVYNSGTNELTAYKGVEAYGVSIGDLKQGTLLNSSTSVDYYQVWNRTRTENGSGGWNAYGGWSAVSTKAPLTGQPHPSLDRPDPYETTYRQNYNNQILGIQNTMPSNMTATRDAMNPPGATVSNNFGSAVIDGLLIQHLKFSTTGL